MSTNSSHRVFDGRYGQIWQRALIAVQFRPRTDEKAKQHEPDFSLVVHFSAFFVHPTVIGEERLQRIASHGNNAKPGRACEHSCRQKFRFISRHPVPFLSQYIILSFQYFFIRGLYLVTSVFFLGSWPQHRKRHLYVYSALNQLLHRRK